MLHNGASNTFVSFFAYGLFTISQILNPLLPVALVAGQSVAARRLAARSGLGLGLGLGFWLGLGLG